MPRNLLNRFFSTSFTSKEYAQRSLLLNIELDSNNRFSFTLSVNTLLTGKSRYECNQDLCDSLTNEINNIDLLCNQFDEGEFLERLKSVQSNLSFITENLIPRNIRDSLFSNKDYYDYLVIEDETLPVNIPYTVLFFPEQTDKSISGEGYFLSELYTILRSSQRSQSTLEVKNVYTLSSDDLLIAKKEELEIVNYLNCKKSNLATILTGIDDFKIKLKEQKGNIYHLCCHGDNNCNISCVKNTTEEIMNNFDFNLVRFPDHSFIFLNICCSNYTVYNKGIPNSIALKLIDHNAELIITTDWSVNDLIGFRIGTSFYRRIIDNHETPLQAIHRIKKSISNKYSKLCAITYSLNGNPNLIITL